LNLVLGTEDGNELVAALADLLVDLVVAEADTVVRESFPPRFDMQVVGVDERAVDIEDDCLQRQRI
jgi:hypothetical protein